MQSKLMSSIVPRFLLAFCLLFGLAGCSAFMAANQPEAKNFEVFRIGTSRSQVLAEFGPPIHSEETRTGKKDIFKFVQGYHGLVRTGRALGHATASIATLGLWEVIGTPVEGYANGTELSVEVNYDEQDTVSKVVPLKGAAEINRNL